MHAIEYDVGRDQAQTLLLLSIPVRSLISGVGGSFISQRTWSDSPPAEKVELLNQVEAMSEIALWTQDLVHWSYGLQVSKWGCTSVCKSGECAICFTCTTGAFRAVCSHLIRACPKLRHEAMGSHPVKSKYGKCFGSRQTKASSFWNKPCPFLHATTKTPYRGGVALCSPAAKRN